MRGLHIVYTIALHMAYIRYLAGKYQSTSLLIKTIFDDCTEYTKRYWYRIASAIYYFITSKYIINKYL